MAALRNGVTTVIIPKENEKDLEEIDQTVRSALNFVSADRIETVLRTALNQKPEAMHTILKDIPDSLKSKPAKPMMQQ